jgi:hypothetical protein
VSRPPGREAGRPSVLPISHTPRRATGAALPECIHKASRMPVTVKVNGVVNSLVHKGSNGVSVATLPDVCKTPSPGGPVPVPYPNIAQSAMLTKGTKTVKADGGMMIAVKGSQFSLSNGDNPGVAGGIKSSTFMKESTWILYSFDVKMDGKNACRLTDKKFHNHENTVNLGGELQSPSAVPPPPTSVENAIKACEEARKGRKRNKKSQSYENCGVECVRQIINRKNKTSWTEDAMLNWALRAKKAEKKLKRRSSGGTNYAQRYSILYRFGVDSKMVPQTMGNIKAATAKGKGVIAAVDVKKLWGPKYNGGHVVLVIGVVEDKDGNVKEVIVNDSGMGDCGKRYPADQFEKALRPGAMLNVTDDSIWTGPKARRARSPARRMQLPLPGSARRG